MDIAIAFKYDELERLIQQNNLEELNKKYLFGIEELASGGSVYVVKNGNILETFENLQSLAKYFSTIGVPVPAEHLLNLKNIFKSIVSKTAKDYVLIMNALSNKLKAEGCTIEFDGGTENYNYTVSSPFEEIYFALKKSALGKYDAIFQFTDKLSKEKISSSFKVDEENVSGFYITYM